MLQVKLSPEAVKLLNAHLKASSADNLPLIDVINYLNDDASPQQLRCLLLQEMISSFEVAFKKSIYVKPPASKLNWKQKLMLGVGVASGLVNVISDAFGNISVLLTTIFEPLSAGFALLWGSLAFVLFCAGSFLIYRLATISKSSDISMFKVSETLSAYLEERRMLNKLLGFMDTLSFFNNHERHGLDSEVLQGLQEMFRARSEFLKTKSMELAKVRAGYFPMIFKGFLLTSLSIWSLTNGFMIGFFALAMISVLVPTVIIPIWGCALCGLVVGLASLYLFWTTMREDITEGVDGIIGVDKLSIKGLSEAVEMDWTVFIKPKTNDIPQPPEHSDNYQPVFQAVKGAQASATVSVERSTLGC